MAYAFSVVGLASGFLGAIVLLYYSIRTDGATAPADRTREGKCLDLLRRAFDPR